MLAAPALAPSPVAKRILCSIDSVHARPRLVDQPADLPAALAGIADLDPVGVDVERADWDRYWRRAALIQVGGDGRVVLVDPLAIGDLGALHEFLHDRLVILHAMENDLAPLESAGVKPVKVADTAVAAGILGLPTGLGILLEQLLGVVLPSDKQAMQRADWEARPIDPEMLAYAEGDVADLPALWVELRKRLVEAGRLSWYEEEMIAQRAQPSIEERRSWTRVKGVGRLDRAGQGRARALWEAREALARETDTAPGRILTDKALVALAEKPPHDVGDLVRRGVRRRAARTFGPPLLSAVAEAEPEAERGRGRRMTDVDRAAADELREIRAAVARDLGIDPGILCPSRTLLRAVLADPTTPEELQEALGMRDWQWALVADAFVEALDLSPDGDRGDDGGTRPQDDVARHAREVESGPRLLP